MAFFSKYLQYSRIKKILPWSNGSVLDLGCADAAILRQAEDRVRDYCGVDLSAERVQELRKRYPQHTFLRLDMDEDPIEIEGQFDTVLMTAFIEHIYNQKHLFKEVLRHLNPNGRIVITTPTLLGDSIHRWGAKLGLFAQSAQDHHPVVFSKHRFRVFAKHFGLEIETYERFQFSCNQLVVLKRRLT